MQLTFTHTLLPLLCLLVIVLIFVTSAFCGFDFVPSPCPVFMLLAQISTYLSFQNPHLECPRPYLLSFPNALFPHFFLFFPSAKLTFLESFLILPCLSPQCSIGHICVKCLKFSSCPHGLTPVQTLIDSIVGY